MGIVTIRHNFRKAVIMIGVAMLVLTACSNGNKKEEKLRDIDFTVVPEKDIPEELMEIIDQSKEKVMRKTFSDKENLYIVVCYGAQPTTGYSITVKELYETKNVVNIRTWLIGPDKRENVSETITYPYIVLKIEYTEKPVVFK